MKKLFSAIFIVLFFSSYLYAMDWKKANQVTFGWDKVTKLEDDSDIPNLSVVRYEVYTKDENGNEILISETDQTSFKVTFQAEGDFEVGVKAVRYRNVGANPGTEVISASDIAWSSDPASTGNSPFGIRHYIAPGMPENLRAQ